MQDKIYLPHGFKPYDHQKIVLNAFLSGEYRKFINVWHRRAGKDTTWFNIMLLSAMQRVGNYLYLLDTIGQARDVIWEGIGASGKKFLDFIPRELIESKNATDMRIRLVNGSTIRIGGTDHYDAHIGTNPLGIVLSEYSLQNPCAWEFLSPIVAENNGWVSFVYTFRGNNHGLELYELNKDNPDFFVTNYTADQTHRHDGSPIMSLEAINALRRSGIRETTIQQEFYNKPTSMEGAYFGKELLRMEDEGRICDFPIDRTKLVHTYWDLGFKDSTAIWLVQQVNGEYIAVAYYENCLSSLDHYINWLHDFRNKNEVVFGDHFAPHDAHKRELGSGKSLVQIAQGLGIRFKVVPKINNKINAIEAARMIFHKMRIHKTNCKQGIKCLKEYHANFNEKLNTFGDPCHNWASHGADAFMGIAQMDKDAMRFNNSNINNGIIHNSVNTGKLF